MGNTFKYSKDRRAMNFFEAKQARCMSLAGRDGGGRVVGDNIGE